MGPATGGTASAGQAQSPPCTEWRTSHAAAARRAPEHAQPHERGVLLRLAHKLRQRREFGGGACAAADAAATAAAHTAAAAALRAHDAGGADCVVHRQ